MVRLIGRNDPTEVTEYWEEWAERIANWIRAGLQPWIFTHAPDDRYAPELASAFHAEMKKRIPSLPDLPWPANQEASSSGSAGYKQLELF